MYFDSSTSKLLCISVAHESIWTLPWLIGTKATLIITNFDSPKEVRTIHLCIMFSSHNIQNPHQRRVSSKRIGHQKSYFLMNSFYSVAYPKPTPISEKSRKLYVVDLANDVHCNFPPEALMNTVSSYKVAYWLKRISYNFLICNLDFLTIQ